MDLWVKLYTSYDSDPAIAAGDDAAEVMFTRGIAYCGRARTGGFIPDAQLHHLTRHPARAKRIVVQLTRATPTGAPGPWEVTTGGYQIRNWEHYQDQLDALEERRKNDRERKRRSRSAKDTAPPDRGVTGQSRDRHGTVRTTEQKQSRTAAAAADTTAAAAPVDNPPGPLDLPPAVEILKAALEAHKLVVRWDRLTPEHLDDIAALTDVHGDGPLVKAALASHRPDKPAAFAQAWVGIWKSLPAPGTPLHALPAPCPQQGHSGTERHCIECAAETKSRADQAETPNHPRAISEELADTRQRLAQNRKARP